MPAEACMVTKLLQLGCIMPSWLLILLQVILEIFALFNRNTAPCCVNSGVGCPFYGDAKAALVAP